MPVVGIPVQLLRRTLGGAEVSAGELVTHLQHLGCDVEGYGHLSRYRCLRCGAVTEVTETQEPPAVCSGCGLSFKEEPGLRAEAGQVEVLRMELLAVRPDLFDAGGLGRALRAYLGVQPGLLRYDLAEEAAELQVAPETQGPRCPRPAIAAAVIRGLRLDDDFLKTLMKLQEDLHWALGRDRKHASIGVYDLDTVEPPFRYRAVAPDGVRFVPLGFPADSKPLTPAEILEVHPKGQAFARLLADFELYPLLEDARGRVLSLPPIINSEQTRVRPETRNLFVDVTGTNRRVVSKALAILVTSAKELAPGCRICRVRVRSPEGELVTPDLEPETVALDVEATARLLGLDLDEPQVRALLERMGHGVEGAGGALQVSVPAWRADVMHPRDLMEDVAIAYGYHNIAPRLVSTMTVGRPDPAQESARLARQVLVGAGYLEVMTLALTSEQEAFGAMRLEPDPRAVLLENPISVEQTMLRISLLPGLLATAGRNTHRELPQRLFEVGPVTLLDPQAETGAAEQLRLAAILVDAKAGAADVRALWQVLARELDLRAEVRNGTWGPFLEGRCAELWADGRLLGRFGEVHPEVLETFGLGHPVAALELDLGGLAARLRR